MSKSAWIWIIIGAALLFSGGIALISVSPTIKKLGEAIATAEGFYIEGSRAQRNNNPGNMTKDLIGKSIGTDGPFVVYASAQDGFNNLYQQIGEILSGTSGLYNPNWSISEVARTYSPDGWIQWANNVANYLGVSTDTPLNQIS